jgi:hypothetical protein
MAKSSSRRRRRQRTRARLPRFTLSSAGRFNEGEAAPAGGGSFLMSMSNLVRTMCAGRTSLAGARIECRAFHSNVPSVNGPTGSVKAFRRGRRCVIRVTNAGSTRERECLGIGWSTFPTARSRCCGSSVKVTSLNESWEIAGGRRWRRSMRWRLIWRRCFRLKGETKHQNDSHLARREQPSRLAAKPCSILISGRRLKPHPRAHAESVLQRVLAD